MSIAHFSLVFLTVILSLHKSFFFGSIYLCILGLHQVLAAACGLFPAVHGLLSRCGLQAAEHVGYVVAAHGLSSCDTPV